MKFRLTADDVTDAKTFAEYCRQQLGAPRPKQKEWAGLNAVLKKFWKANPDCTRAVMTRGVTEAGESGIRGWESTMAVVWFIEKFINDGSVVVDKPEDPIDTEITNAMREEEDPEWRLRLAAATGDRRRTILEEWRAK